MRKLLVMLASLVCFAASAQEASTNSTAVHFRAADVYVDSKDLPLAAYQLDLSIVNTDAKIVGIEGGEPRAFAEPPFYDPEAMQHDRVIIAAFSTNAPSALPSGKTRVATIHFQTASDAAPEFKIKLHVAADAAGNRIAAEATVEERKK